MHIVYAVTVCTDRAYRQLFSDAAVKPAFQAQKYHRLLIEGLAKHAKVDVVANPPVNREVLNKAFVRLPKEEECGATYYPIAAVRNPLAKLAWMMVATFLKTLRLTHKSDAVVVDCLNRTVAFSALLAAKLKGGKCVGILTDLPDMLGGSGFFVKMGNFVIRHCTHYVVMTEAMNTYVGNKDKPYIVLEGHADIAMRDRVPSTDKKAGKRICFYAGGVSKQYGLGNLVDGFCKAKLENAQLHIYGPGDYVDELKEIAAKNPNVVYGGMLMNHEIVEKEQQATLLVNPRPTDEEYVKYSFPSKTMEYMASGTPVLTTVLPGMPREYHPYVFLLKDETADGIASALEKIWQYTDEELFEKGQKARAFVLDERNNEVQAGKMVQMLKK